MFNTSKYEYFYSISLQATRTHRAATSFLTRAAAREQLDEAQLQLARMHKMKSFEVDVALEIATRLKSQPA